MVSCVLEQQTTREATTRTHSNMAETLLIPNTVLQGTNDRYTILKLIGRGGMGAVYKAQRASDTTIWAVKEMRPPPTMSLEETEDNRKLFDQEVALLRSLEHINIPVVTDYFHHEDRPVMVMEFIDGQTLEDLLHSDKNKLDEQQIISFGIQICQVLHYLHSQTPPIIYRDLKPPNVMITSDRVIKLIDFGVARTRKEHKTKDTIAMGSAGYAPPEQYGKAQTDARSDVYALGATMLHLATGMPPVPFQTPRPGDIRKFLPTMKARTEKVIIKAMALKREQRFTSCAEMEQALHSCLDKPYADPTKHTSRPVAAADVKTVDVSPPSPAPKPPVAPPPVIAPAPPSAPQGALCKHCGRVNKDGAKFCAGCGMPLGGPPVARLLVRTPRGTWEMQLDRLPFRIGRRDPRQHHYPELDLAEHDRGVASRHHATIQLKGDVYILTDLGSTNGTLINETRVPPHAPQRLKPGDRIRIGEVDMEFRWS